MFNRWGWGYWYGHDDGQVGDVEFSGEYRTERPSTWFLCLKLFALGGLWMAGNIFLPIKFPLPWWQTLALYNGGLLIYIGLAFFIRPKPNTDNMGLLGGLVDNPFRYTDDWNRNLMSFDMILAPGRAIAQTMLDTLALMGLADDVIVEEQPLAEAANPFAADDQVVEDYAAKFRQPAGESAAPPYDSPPSGLSAAIDQMYEGGPSGSR